MSDATETNDVTPPDRWQLCDGGIEWDVAADTRLPHCDHFEMSGLYVSVIVRYRVDADRRLTLTKEVIWPTFRTREGDVRGYLRRTFGPETEPALLLNEESVTLPPVTKIVIDRGIFSVHYKNDIGQFAFRHIYPTDREPSVWDFWWYGLEKGSETPASAVRWQIRNQEETADGVDGPYHIAVEKSNRTRNNDECAVHYHASTRTFPERLWLQHHKIARGRQYYWDEFRDMLTLKTPEPILNTAFQFARLRAAESVFETKMGRVHSPGGGRYYGGIWANDQAEYSGPFLGYLGRFYMYSDEAALTAYRNFIPYMKPDFEPIPSSLEMEGTIPYRGAGDRGDAAMYAGGASRYLLSVGNREIAEELYPAVQWCLEYCHRKTNADGVVESDTDELEGRFPTGKANLSTSCLAYDGLRRGADLARALGHEADGREYDQRADALEAAIEAYFGAVVEGFHTYRYYDGNTTLRAWICLPLCFGIGRNNPERVQGTLDALFSPRLWTPDGLATESGGTVFWDRSTLFALRGAFFAGDTDRAYRYLLAYSRRRLLGDHVPYPVEAYPEGDQAHLSAESALYCRVFTEGLFGYVPTGFDKFTITPRLPSGWDDMTLTLAMADRSTTVIDIHRDYGYSSHMDCRITRQRNDSVLAEGGTIEVRV